MGFFDFSGGKPIKITAPYKQDFYLISCGALHPKEIPDFIQNYQRQLAELEAFRIQAAVAWAEKSSASPEDAALWLEKTKSTLWMQYLPASERVLAQNLGNSMNALGANYGAFIATQMMQFRLAWHIITADKAAIGATQLKIEEPWFSTQRILCEGDRLKSLSGVVIRVSETYRDDGVLNVGKLSRQLPAGEPFFLLSSSGGYEQGDPSWGLPQTTEFLTKESSIGKTQLEQIQDFYAAESAKAEVKEDEEIPLAEDLTTLENTPDPKSLTGANSTDDSSILDAEIAGLPLIPSS